VRKLLLKQQLACLSRGAAACGNRDVLDWAKAAAGAQWSEWRTDLCMSAAAGNQLATLQWLRAIIHKEIWAKVTKKAAEHADLTTLQTHWRRRQWQHCQARLAVRTLSELAIRICSPSRRSAAVLALAARCRHDFAGPGLGLRGRQLRPHEQPPVCAGRSRLPLERSDCARSGSAGWHP
jgi:hypothetical protein